MNLPFRFGRASRLACSLALVLAAAGGSLGAQDYKEEVDAIKEATKLPLRMEETANFVWVYTIGTANLKKAAEAGERAFKVWQEISGATSWEQMWAPSREGTRKCLVFVMKNKLDYRRIINWYDDKYAPYQGFKDVATPQSYITTPSPRVAIFSHALPVSEPDLTHVIAHEVGHICIQRFAYHNNHLPPWLEEGFALWMEARVMQKTNCYCFSGGYGDSAAGVKDMGFMEWKKWRELNSRLAGRGADKNMKELLRLRLNEMSTLDAGKAASVVDFMIATDPKKFSHFLQRMKAAWPQGDYDPAFKQTHLAAQERGLKESYDWSLEQLDAEWRTWAKRGMK